VLRVSGRYDCVNSADCVALDGEGAVDESLPELVGILREASGRRRNVFPLPNSILKFALSALGRAEEYARVAEPLLVSHAKLQSLGWTPVLGTREALIRYAQSENQV